MSRSAVASVEASARLRRGVKALITVSDRVLLVKESHDDGSIFWTLPGGGARAGESKVDALRRELHEELGCRISVDSERTSVWYAHSSCEQFSRYTVFDCSLLSSPKPNLADGILECQWVTRTDTTPRTLPLVEYVLERTDSEYVR